MQEAAPKDAQKHRADRRSRSRSGSRRRHQHKLFGEVRRRGRRGARRDSRRGGRGGRRHDGSRRRSRRYRGRGRRRRSRSSSNSSSSSSRSSNSSAVRRTAGAPGAKLLPPGSSNFSSGPVCPVAPPGSAEGAGGTTSVAGMSLFQVGAVVPKAIQAVQAAAAPKGLLLAQGSSLEKLSSSREDVTKKFSSSREQLLSSREQLPAQQLPSQQELPSAQKQPQQEQPQKQPQEQEQPQKEQHGETGFSVSGSSAPASKVSGSSAPVSKAAGAGGAPVSKAIAPAGLLGSGGLLGSEGRGEPAAAPPTKGGKSVKSLSKGGKSIFEAFNGPGSIYGLNSEIRLLPAAAPRSSDGPLLKMNIAPMTSTLKPVAIPTTSKAAGAPSDRGGPPQLRKLPDREHDKSFEDRRAPPPADDFTSKPKTAVPPAWAGAKVETLRGLSPPGAFKEKKLRCELRQTQKSAGCVVDGGARPRDSSPRRRDFSRSRRRDSSRRPRGGPRGRSARRGVAGSPAGQGPRGRPSIKQKGSPRRRSWSSNSSSNKRQSNQRPKQRPNQKSNRRRSQSVDGRPLSSSSEDEKHQRRNNKKSAPAAARPAPGSLRLSTPPPAPTTRTLKLSNPKFFTTLRQESAVRKLIANSYEVEVDFVVADKKKRGRGSRSRSDSFSDSFSDSSDDERASFGGPKRESGFLIFRAKNAKAVDLAFKVVEKAHEVCEDGDVPVERVLYLLRRSTNKISSVYVRLEGPLPADEKVDQQPDQQESVENSPGSSKGSLVATKFSKLLDSQATKLTIGRDRERNDFVINKEHLSRTALQIRFDPQEVRGFFL